MKQDELQTIIEKRKAWLNDEPNGNRADLWGADLWGADLRGADLRGADLWGANLREANLREANLREANLRRANLWNCVGDGAVVKSMQLATYDLAVWKDALQIGCERHTIKEWEAFTDEDIESMDSGTALDWWLTYKDLVLMFAKTRVDK